MRILLSFAVLMGFVMSSMNVMSEEACTAPAAKAAVKAEKKGVPVISLIGKIVKETKKEGDKDVVSYFVETKDGRVALPADTQIADNLVGQECKLKFEGEKTKSADGKESVTVKKVVKCDDLKTLMEKAEKAKAEKAAKPKADKDASCPDAK